MVNYSYYKTLSEAATLTVEINPSHYEKFRKILPSMWPRYIEKPELNVEFPAGPTMVGAEKKVLVFTLTDCSTCISQSQESIL